MSASLVASRQQVNEFIFIFSSNQGHFIAMQGFTGWLKGSVPDNEPSLVADWKSYANNQPNSTAARTDGMLSSAEEGTSSLSGFWSSTFSSFTSAANGAAGSLNSGMSRYVQLVCESLTCKLM